MSLAMQAIKLAALLQKVEHDSTKLQYSVNGQILTREDYIRTLKDAIENLKRIAGTN